MERNLIENARSAQSAGTVSTLLLGHRGLPHGLFSVLHRGRPVRGQGRGGLRHGGGESGRPLHQRHVLHRRHLRRGHQYHPVHLSGAGQPGARQPSVLPESGAAGGHRPDHHRSGADLSEALCPAAGGGGGNAGLHHVVPEGAGSLCHLLHRVV